jgi:micrococcal nuclease
MSFRSRRLLARRRVRGLLVFVALLLVVAARLWLWPLPKPGARPARTAVVLRVVDGDTLLLAGGERVRLLGVDTPETKRPDHPVQPLGPEAYEFTRAGVEGRTVRLEFDRERRDVFGRLLAYVYRDEWFLNEELIRAGLGKAQLQYPYSEVMKRRFRDAEHHARLHRRGLWFGK